MLQSCFYQIAEYVMAPFGLMLFTFYVKNLGATKTTYKPIIETNGIESLFIACYSCMLFYLSIVAHSDAEIDLVYENAKSAILLGGFFGMIFIFILKYHAKNWGEDDNRSNSWPNKTALGLMIFLFIVIIYKNTHGFSGFKPTQVDFVSYIKDAFFFIIVPSNSIVLVFMTLIAYFYTNNTRIMMGRRVESNIDEYAKISDDRDIKSYSRASSNILNPPHIKVQSLVKIAESLIDNDNHSDIEKARDKLILAKDIAIENSFPPNIEYGIRKLLIKTYKLLNYIDLGQNEIDEFILKNTNSNSHVWIKYGNSWESKMKEILK